MLASQLWGMPNVTTLAPAISGPEVDISPFSVLSLRTTLKSSKKVYLLHVIPLFHVELGRSPGLQIHG